MLFTALACVLPKSSFAVVLWDHIFIIGDVVVHGSPFLWWSVPDLTFSILPWCPSMSSKVQKLCIFLLFVVFLGAAALLFQAAPRKPISDYISTIGMQISVFCGKPQDLQDILKVLFSLFGLHICKSLLSCQWWRHFAEIWAGWVWDVTSRCSSSWHSTFHISISIYSQYINPAFLYLYFDIYP